MAVALQALKYKQGGSASRVCTFWAGLGREVQYDEALRAWSRAVLGVRSQVFRKKRAAPNRLRRGCPFSFGGGAGNRTPVRQGPTAGFSVRSPRF